MEAIEYYNQHGQSDKFVSVYVRFNTVNKLNIFNTVNTANEKNENAQFCLWK